MDTLHPDEHSSRAKIAIKAAHKGLLHKDLGIPQGEKIPPSDLTVKTGDNPALVKRKTFAKNASKWNK